MLERHYKRHFTFVPPQPNLKAASWAKSSPNPNMSPLINGNRRLIAAPRSKLHSVGGEYRIIGEFEEDGGDGESSSLPEYCSLSERMVMEDSDRGIDSDAIVKFDTRTRFDRSKIQTLKKSQKDVVSSKTQTKLVPNNSLRPGCRYLCLIYMAGIG